MSPYTSPEPLGAELNHERDADSSKPVQRSSEAVPLPAITTPVEEKELVYLTGSRLFMVNFAVTLAATLLFLDMGIIATAIPRITDEFNSLPDVGWYAGAYQLGSAALMPLSGKIFQRFSSKWSYLGFFGLFEIGSILCGAAASSKMLIIGRAVAGMGGSGIVSGALTIIASSVSLEKRATATGIMLGVSQMGVVLGPLLGGVFTEFSTWRWCFYFNLPTGALCLLVLAFVRIPDQIEKPNPLAVLRRLHHELDLVGFMLFAPAAIMLLLALEYGADENSWSSSTVIGLFCGAVAEFLVWLIWNWRAGDDALIPVSMVLKRTVWASSLLQGFSMTSLFIITYYLPIFFQAVQDASPLISGVHLLPTIVSQLTFAVLAGALVSKTGYVIPYALFGGACASMGSGFFSTLNQSSSIGSWFGFQVLAGVGRGTAMQMPMIAVQSSQSTSEISMVNSLLMFSVAISSSIFIVVADTVFVGSLRSAVSTYAPRVDVEAVIAAGATGFRAVVGADDLPSVIDAYSKSLDNVFYISVACAIIAFFLSFGLGWVDIRKRNTKIPKASDEAQLEAGEKP